MKLLTWGHFDVKRRIKIYSDILIIKNKWKGIVYWLYDNNLNIVVWIAVFEERIVRVSGNMNFTTSFL